MIWLRTFAQMKTMDFCANENDHLNLSSNSSDPKYIVSFMIPHIAKLLAVLISLYETCFFQVFFHVHNFYLSQHINGIKTHHER